MNWLRRFLPFTAIIFGMMECILMAGAHNKQAAIWSFIAVLWALNTLIEIETEILLTQKIKDLEQYVRPDHF